MIPCSDALSVITEMKDSTVFAEKEFSRKGPAKSKVSDEYIVEVKGRWFHLQVFSQNQNGIEIVTARSGFEIKEPHMQGLLDLVRYRDLKFAPYLSLRSQDIPIPKTDAKTFTAYSIHVGADRFNVRILAPKAD